MNSTTPYGLPWSHTPTPTHSRSKCRCHDHTRTHLHSYYLLQHQVLDASKLLKDYKKSGYVPGVTDEELWAARSLTASALHPDTGELIPRPFRMSGFLVFNAPICVGAVMATSTPAIALVHWMNQTHNALINYSNRNASSPLSNVQLFVSYCTAVGSAVSVAFGLATAIKTRLPPAQAAAALRYGLGLGEAAGTGKVLQSGEGDSRGGGGVLQSEMRHGAQQ